MPLTAQERQQYGSVGGLESWARTEDRAERTAPGRAAFLARFDEYPDPEAARRAYFKRLALKSAQSRRRNSSRRDNAIPTDKRDGVVKTETDYVDPTHDALPN
jgi:hypothetical protein